MTSLSIITTSLVSFGITLLVGMILIPILKKLHFGQHILEDGPKWHMSKQGTPTMGGIMFIAGIVIGVIIGYLTLISIDKNALRDNFELVQLFGGLSMAFMFGLIGFSDDYIKIVKKRNLGLRASQKIILQIIVTSLYLVALYIGGDRSTVINVPFLGQCDLGALYFPIMGILIIGIVNSVNLTDGVDGLCGCVTFVVGIFFMFAASVLKLLGISLLASALAAGCVAFLIFNVHPAKVFMGDTGSMFLGGMVVALGFGINMEFILFFAGFIYCCESLSVILQVISFKLTGKRIFKMSPIHHHFELCGVSENKICVLFSAVTVFMCLLGMGAVIK